MAATSPATAPALTPPPGNPRFPLLDGMRAIAALSILLTHSAGVSDFNTDNPLGTYTARLNVGVTLFFLLSGFLLYRPFVAARREGRPPVRTRDFLRRRVLRIVPAYWVALTLLAIFPGLLGIHDPQTAKPSTRAIITLAAQGKPAPAPLRLARPVTVTAKGQRYLVHDGWWTFYVFGQIYTAKTTVEGIGPAWTLCIEATFYLLLPFLALGMAKLRPRVGIEIAILALMALASIDLRTILQSAGGSYVLQNTLPCFLDWFAWGMILAVLSVATHGRERESRVLTTIVRRPWLPWLGCAFAFWLMSTQFGLARGFYLFYSDLSYLGEHVFYGLCAVLLMLPAVFGDWAGGWPRRLLGHRWMAWLGLVSYGIFLYHAPIMLEVNRRGAQGWLPGSGLASLTLVTAAIAIACATASYYLIERPVLRFKDRGPRRPAAVAASAKPSLDRAEGPRPGLRPARQPGV